MAKLLIKGHKKFENKVCPHIPYYKIQVELVSNAAGVESVKGEVVFNYEYERWNWRWADPELLDHFDMRWQNGLEKELSEYCQKYLSGRDPLAKEVKPYEF